LFDEKPKLFKLPQKGEVLGEDPMHINDLPLKKVPDYMRKRGGIWYWTGALITMAFVYQVITGLLLLLYYVPSDAYNSTEAIITTVPYGSLILTTHLYGAYAMIFLIYVHLFRNYFFGSYKKPRQLQWVLGVLLLALTIGVGFFGYSMTGDVLSSDATDVGRGIAKATPFLGNYLESIFFGNGTSTSLFSHMLAWHIILVALIGIVFGAHFWLAEANGIMPSHRETNHKAPAVDKNEEKHKEWYPYNFSFMTQLAMFAFGFIILIPSILSLLAPVSPGPASTFPALFSPFPQVSPSSPNAAYVPAYPPWFLLFVYKAVDFDIFAAAGNLSALAATAVIGVIPLLYFLLLPFIDTTDDLHPLSRPLVTSFGILGIIYMAILSAWGALSPGVQIPNYEVFAVLLPPFVVVVGGMTFLSRQYKKGKFKITGTKILTSFLLFLFVMMFGAYVFGQNFTATLAHTSLLNLVATFFTGGVMVFGAVGTAKSARLSNKYDSTKQKQERSAYRMNKNTAVVLSALLAIAAIVITYLIFSLNPIGAINNGEFGIGLAFILIIAGTIMRIYRAAFYYE
jgi:quinol-cytochrome oxidoreductase complex cytochrome b subunit/uncharacterized membrane protein YidH (DUF202 family)